MKNFVDGNFTHHRAVSQVWSKMALILATTPVIPFGVVEYGEKLKELFTGLNNSYFKQLAQENITLSECI